MTDHTPIGAIGDEGRRSDSARCETAIECADGTCSDKQLLDGRFAASRYDVVRSHTRAVSRAQLCCGCGGRVRRADLLSEWYVWWKTGERGSGVTMCGCVESDSLCLPRCAIGCGVLCGVVRYAICIISRTTFVVVRLLVVVPCTQRPRLASIHHTPSREIMAARISALDCTSSAAARSTARQPSLSLIPTPHNQTTHTVRWMVSNTAFQPLSI